MLKYSDVQLQKNQTLIFSFGIKRGIFTIFNCLCYANQPAAYYLQNILFYMYFVLCNLYLRYLGNIRIQSGKFGNK